LSAKDSLFARFLSIVEPSAGGPLCPLRPTRRSTSTFRLNVGVGYRASDPRS
jgi:hypothetical protein